MSPVGQALGSWLVQQAARPNPAGDVARYLYADLARPGVGAGSEELRAILAERGAPAALLVGLSQAEAEWSGDLRQVVVAQPRQRDGVAAVASDAEAVADDRERQPLGNIRGWAQ